MKFAPISDRLTGLGAAKWAVEPEALLAIANHLSKRSGNPVTPDEVLYTAGTQNGLCTALFTLVEAADEVLVPDPYYATHEGLVAAQ